MTRRLVNQIAGISRYTNRLSQAGIETADDLIEACQDSAKRERACDRADVSPEQMEAWFHMADLSRVPGVTPQYIVLLEMCDVHSAEQLAEEDPELLTVRLVEANLVEHVCHAPPNIRVVEDWIESAKELPPITYH